MTEVTHDKGSFAGLLLMLALAASSLAGDAGLQGAWKDVGYLDYRRALPQFEKLRKAAEPPSDAWCEATLGLALCLQQRQPDVKGEKDRAAELYDELIAASDGKSIQATALLLRGKLAQLIDYFGDKEDFDVAAGFYSRILRDWPESSCENEAAIYLAQTAIFRMEKKVAAEAVDILKKWIAAHPHNPHVATQWLLVSLACRMPLEDNAAAVEASLKAVDAGLPEEMSVDTLYWRIATMAESVGNKAVARDFYTRIIVEVQRSCYTYSAQQRIKEMGFDPPALIDPFDSE